MQGYWSHHRSIWIVSLAATVLFISLALCLIPYPGLEDDEVLFAQILFPWHLTPMVASYVGTLKTLIYLPIFGSFGVSSWSLRLPMVLVGALTIFFFLRIACSSGFAAGIMGVAILATEPSFLLTNTFDRGPVALTQLLLVAGCLFLMRSAIRKQPGDGVYRSGLCIPAGFFCFGLAMWNKAIFVWALAGLLAGGLMVFWPEARRLFTLRRTGQMLAGFLLGLSPLAAYNLYHFNVTASENARLEDLGALPGKWIALRNVAAGSLFEEDFVSLDGPGRLPKSASVKGRIALWVADHSGHLRRTGFEWVFAGLVMTVYWWWRSRAARFSFVFLVVSWAAMAATRGGGAYSSHIILLWPFPFLFAGVALASLPWRWFAASVCVVLVTMNLLVLGEYMALYETNGPNQRFTDAMTPLASSLMGGNLEVWSADWGIAGPLRALSQGRLQVHGITGELLSDIPSEADQLRIRAMITDPYSVVVAHDPDQPMFDPVFKATPALATVVPRLEWRAGTLGYSLEKIRTIRDSKGRSVYLLFHFVRLKAAG
jgi:hypothetical protein